MEHLQRIGPFEVCAPLGRGGMGTVYQVRDSEGRILALKLLSRPDEEFVHRFKREFRAASRLRHHNIVAVYELGEDPAPYFTMEYVEGANLVEYLQIEGKGQPIRDPESIRRLFFALGQALKALDYIHAQGIVHRDLKPDNILVNREGAIKVTDFGLAKLVGSDSFVTDRGVLLGTIAYVAPEQVAGGQVDARTDFYALGVILYKVLAGRLPYQGKDSLRILRQKLAVAEPPDPREYNPELPEPWARINLRLLQREPARRYQDIPALFTDLRAAWAETSARAGARRGPRLDDKGLLTEARGALTAPRFVGRDQEMALLEKVLESLHQKTRAFALVGGPPGVGKSRLVEELRGRARARGLKVAAGRAPAESRLPFALFRAPLERTAKRLSRWPRDEVLEAVTREGRVLTPLVPLFNSVEALAELPQPAPLPPAEARERTLHVLEALFESLARRAPMLLVLEDLHDADEASLALVRRFLRHTGRDGVPLGVVATYRTEERAPNDAFDRFLREQGMQDALRVTLAGLSREALAELLATMTGGTEPDSKILERLHLLTRGNPLHLEQVVKTLVDRGALVRSEGRWVLEPERIAAALPRARPGVPETTPEGVSGAVRVRLTGFTPEVLQVLEVAAVMGLSFRADTVERVLGRSEEAILDALAEILKTGLVVEQRGTASEYSFEHERVRNALLVNLPSGRLRQLHARVAEALEELGPADPNARAAALAHHYDRAAMPLKALGHLPQAAAWLARSYNNEEALAAYRRALALLAALEPAQRAARSGLAVELRLGAGEVAELTGHHEEALKLYREALQVAGESGSAAAALNAEAGLLWTRGDYAQAEKLAHDALAGARKNRARDQEARALEVLGKIARRRDELENAEGFFEAALDIRRELDDKEGQARDLADLGIVARNRDRHARAMELFELALATNTERGNSRGIAIALSHIGTLHVRRCEYDAAISRYRQALELDEQMGNRRGIGYGYAHIGITELTRGGYAEAEESFQLALEVFRELPDRPNAARAVLNLGHVAFRQDQLDKALGLYGEAQKLLEELGDRRVLSEALAGQALVEGTQGRAQEARTHAERAIKEARAAGARDKEAWAWFSLARAASDRKAAERAHALAMKAQDPNLGFQTLGYLASLAREDGDEATASQALERALELVESQIDGLDQGRDAFLARPAVREIYQAAGKPPPRG